MEKKQGFQLGNPLGLWPSIEEIPFAFDLAIVSKEWKGAGLTTVKPVRSGVSISDERKAAQWIAVIAK